MANNNNVQVNGKIKSIFK